MKRRDAVKGIILFSLGTGIIYSCKDKYQAIRDLGLKHFEPVTKELDLIDQLSRMIVPLQSIPELVNHTPLPFMFTMLDDVYKPIDRDAFLNGYQNFDQVAEDMTGTKFRKMKEEDAAAFISRFNSKEEGLDKDMQKFYDIVKGESLRYLKTSEYYQRKINYYEMAPGRFKGDVLISELKNANEI
ncbi:MAG: gluconate 2-dehydrogenase subunit 3 family protein [Bacteroidota bacterium]